MKLNDMLPNLEEFPMDDEGADIAADLLRPWWEIIATQALAEGIPESFIDGVVAGVALGIEMVRVKGIPEDWPR